MPPTTIHALHDDLLAHIFSKVGYLELHSRSPVEEVCQRWRRVYNTTPRIWGVIDRFDLQVVHELLLNYSMEPHMAAPRFVAAAVILARMRRRAPGIRELELWEACDDQADLLNVCPVTAQAVLMQLRAAPLQRLELELAWASGDIWAQLGQHAAMLTELRLHEGRVAPAAAHPGRGSQVGWDVVAAHLASLQQLRSCSLSLVRGNGDSPAMLLAVLGSLSNLEWLHLTFQIQHGGSDGQQQEVLLPTDLGLLAHCKRLSSVHLAVQPQLAGHAAMQPVAVLEAQLSAEAARQLSALTSLLLVSDTAVGQEVHVEQLASLQQLRLVGEPTGRAWRSTSLTSLSCWRALMEDPDPAVGDAGALPRLLQLELRECEFLRSRLPVSLFHLRHLTELVLSRCTDAFAASQGELPHAATQLTSLRSLRLPANGLHQVPSVVLQLTGLRRLELDSNPLQELPEALTALRHLQVLQLSNTHLTGVPSVLYRLSSLLVLDMSNTLVRPSHLDLAKIREHKFLPSREDTFVYLGADMEAEEDLETVQWSTADIYRLKDLRRVRPNCLVLLSTDSHSRNCEIESEFERDLGG